jgi:2-C-methyl-D-erythritol 4-phosphate cytidylyltransferase
MIIHDGVRPVFPQRLIEKGVRLCRTHKAVIVGAPVRETIKEVKKGSVIRTIQRRSLYLIKTPQFFECRLLKHAYRHADLTVEYTDDAALCESLDIPIRLITDHSFNIKVTKPTDVALVKRMV